MAKLIRNIAATVFMGAGLAACGGGGGNDTPAPPVVVTPPAAARIEDSVSANFGTAYRADANTDAKDPVPGDLPPLSLTTEATTI